jgi:hypothetical protein
MLRGGIAACQHCSKHKPSDTIHCFSLRLRKLPIAFSNYKIKGLTAEVTCASTAQ